jgi:hypothetical protein
MNGQGTKRDQSQHRKFGTGTSNYKFIASGSQEPAAIILAQNEAKGREWRIGRSKMTLLL